MVGQATLSVTVNSNNIQSSNFGTNSFLITNTGTKSIAQVVIDVTNALYPDSVFDPFGLAGDTAFKPLTIDASGNTGVVAPTTASYIGVGGKAGYEGLKLTFDSNVNGGFNPGETLGFSIDMDPNSVAGALKSPLDAGSSPSWDVGGVSGAELIGSTFTVTFTDGTTATGQLQGSNTQAGSQGLASQNSPNLAVSLTVNGLNAGGVGTYSASGPSVIINGPAGQTARVVLTKGFIQPVTSYAQFLADQLAVLAATGFPANNAVEFQTVDVVLTGSNQDISNLFNFSGVAAYNFTGEDKLPLGFVASVIDPNNKLPIGPVTQPIYLKFDESNVSNAVTIAATQNGAEGSANGLFTVSLSQASATDTVLSYTVAGTATAGSDYTALSGTVTILAGQLSAAIPVSIINDTLVEGTESVLTTLTGVTGAADVGLGSTTAATVTIADNDQPATTLMVQAESITNVMGYRLESNNVATGGSMLSLVGGASNETGKATFNFTGATGTYNVIIGVFDENDGVATLQVSKSGTSIGSILLNQNLGSASVTAATKVERLVASGVTIANGETFTVTGIENANEHARFDFIRFESVASATPTVSIAGTTNGAEGGANGLFTVTRSQVAATNTVVSYTVGGTATAGSDYTALSGTVTILAGQTSATIPISVANDTLVEGNETVSITLTGVTGASAALGTATANITISDNDQPLSTITLQAEAANTIVNYRTESISAATGGQVLSFVGGASNESGSATFIFGDSVDELTGTYNIAVGVFDENDGLASFTVQLKDSETNITTQIGSLTLNANLGSQIANNQTKVILPIATGISLTPGDSLIVNGFENQLEHARFDFLQLVPVV